MKKIYSLILFACAGLAMHAQNGIPNGNFESWTSNTYEDPLGLISSNPSSFGQCGVFNCLKVADPEHGSFALQLTTHLSATDTCFGYAINADPNGSGGLPCNWPGGLPFTQTPLGLRGYYKSNEQSGDSGILVVAFRNAGTCLGMYSYKFGGVQSTYAPFTIDFNPPLAGTPDTMVFIAISSDVFNGVSKNGSMLQLDSLSFIGITPQPVGFDGDFETWQSTTIESPDNWYIVSNGSGVNGVAKTTDANAGVYAAELTTYLGDNNGNPVARGASISTGYYPNNCGGPCPQLGGYPFSNQVDTLAFYYKYAPMGNDTAEVNIQFKFMGNPVSMMGMPIYNAASTYQYMEIYFNTGAPIDTAIVSFQSSNWRDSALSYVGTVLKVDEVHFKSQPQTTGIKMYDASVGIKVFPNPSQDGNFVVSNVGYYDLVRVMNVYGQEINAEIRKTNGTAQIHIPAAGAYTVFVNSSGKTTSLKVIVGKE